MISLWGAKRSSQSVFLCLCLTILAVPVNGDDTEIFYNNSSECVDETQTQVVSKKGGNLLFIIDDSNSMHGSKYETVRDAVKNFLEKSSNINIGIMGLMRHKPEHIHGNKNEKYLRNRIRPSPHHSMQTVLLGAWQKWLQC